MSLVGVANEILFVTRLLTISTDRFYMYVTSLVLCLLYKNLYRTPLNTHFYLYVYGFVNGQVKCG